MNEQDRLEKRVQDLESLIAFQDRKLSKLDEVLTQFAAQVERLAAKAKSDEDEPAEVGEQLDPPPHY